MNATAVKEGLTTPPMKDQITTLQLSAESWTPQRTLAWAFEKFGGSVAISSAFGAEGMVLIDMASRLRRDFRLFTIDTEFLFPETYALMDRIEEKYGIQIERVYSVLSPEEQERSHGAALWGRDPDLCCNLRKVEPLRRKLKDLNAWITSIRRDQTSARSTARRIEWDGKFALVKINPIVDSAPLSFRLSASALRSAIVRKPCSSSPFMARYAGSSANIALFGVFSLIH